jgi:AmmeMemoRadiSam system protein A
MLTDTEKRHLLDIARHSVFATVGAETRKPMADVPLPHASGVFVTIKRHGELRGCLGTLSGVDELGREVARCAADSAQEDPRFSPVTRDEVTDLSFEISVLGPLEQIDPLDPATITVGRHGLVVEQGRHRGLLLPQVAIEWEWTREQFLRHTCLKAGLPYDAWQRGAAVFRFEAEVFGE